MKPRAAQFSQSHKILVLLLAPCMVWIVIIYANLPVYFKPILAVREWTLLLIIMPIVEESVFRGLIQEQLQQYLKNKLILVITVNALFVAMHYHVNNNIWYLAGIAVSGLIFSYIKLITHKLSWAILFHSYYNLTFIIFTYSYSRS